MKQIAVKIVVCFVVGVAVLVCGAWAINYFQRLTPEVITLNQQKAAIEAETAKVRAEYEQKRLDFDFQQAMTWASSLVGFKMVAFKAWIIGMIAVPLLCLCIGTVYYSAGKFRQKSLVQQHIGGNTITVHYSMLKHPIMNFVLSALVTAEQTKSIYPEKALALLETLFGMMTANMRKGFIPQQAMNLPAQPDRPALAPKMPTFREVATYLEKGDDLVFGYTETGEPKTGTWVDLFSSAIGGQSGQGKTATLRSIIAQSLLTAQVSTFWVIDFHYPHPKSLLASLGALKSNPAIRWVENPFDIPKLLQEVEDTIDRRLRLEEASEPVKVLVCDEVLVLCDRIPAMSHVIKRIGTESRKCGVYGLFSSQSWKADSVGGSEVRDCLTSRIAHKMQPKQANMLLQDSDQSKLVKDLTTGRVLFVPTNGEPEILRVPYCDPDDMSFVVNRLQPASVTSTTSQETPGTTNEPAHDESHELTLTPATCKTWRKEYDVSQQDLADQSGLKNKMQVCRFENGSESALTDDEKLQVLRVFFPEKFAQTSNVVNLLQYRK